MYTDDWFQGERVVPQRPCSVVDMLGALAERRVISVYDFYRVRPHTLTGLVEDGGVHLYDDGTGNLVRRDTHEVLGRVDYASGELRLWKFGGPLILSGRIVPDLAPRLPIAQATFAAHGVASTPLRVTVNTKLSASNAGANAPQVPPAQEGDLI